VNKVSEPTCKSAGLLAGRVHLTGTSGTLAGGDPWVPMSHRVISSCNNAFLLSLKATIFIFNGEIKYSNVTFVMFVQFL
jgi:hypothetical protein